MDRLDRGTKVVCTNVYFDRDENRKRVEKKVYKDLPQTVIGYISDDGFAMASKYSVILENRKNPRSKCGYYYFKKYLVEPLDNIETFKPQLILTMSKMFNSCKSLNEALDLFQDINSINGAQLRTLLYNKFKHKTNWFFSTNHL